MRILSIVLIFIACDQFFISAQAQTNSTMLNSRITKIEKRLKDIEAGEKDLLQIASNDFKTANALIQYATFILGGITVFLALIGFAGFFQMSRYEKEKKRLEELRRDYQESLRDFKDREKEVNIQLNMMYAYCEGVTHYQLSNYRNALNSFKKALEINPKDYNTNCYLALTYTLRGDFTKAIVTARLATGLDETPDLAYYIEGEAWRFDRNYKNAVAAFNNSIKLIGKKSNVPPDVKNYNVNSTLNQLGYCYLRNKQIPNAITCFGKVLSRNKENDSAHTGLGKCYLTNGKEQDWRPHFERAIKHSLNILKNRPSFWQHYNLAFSYLAIGNEKKCLSSIDKAFNMNNNPIIIKEQYVDYKIIKNLNEELLKKCCEKFENMIRYCDLRYDDLDLINNIDYV